MKKLILIVSLFFIFGKLYPQEQDSIAQTREIKYDKTENLTPIEFSRNQIEAYKTQKEFEYINTTFEDSWWTRFKKWINAKYNQFLNWLFGEYEPNGILAFFISIIPFLLLLVFLGLVAWLFSRLNPGGRILKEPKPSEVFLSEEEELVKNEDLPSLIKKAVADGEFRHAVRYYYLNELKKLDNLNLIGYEFQKTNRDYSEEIENENIRQHFSRITKLYEFIWYGSFQVSEKDYRLAEKGFLNMDNALKNLQHE